MAFSLRDFILVIDDREQKVYPHLLVEAAEINYVKRRITVGDYVLVNRKTKQILAVFERKSLEDFGASLKDGRHLNHKNLTDLRKTTGCRIIYILEGPAHPKPTQTFARIEYSKIESCVFHLMMRDNILPMLTMNTQHTVQKLVSFIKSMCNLMNVDPLTDISSGYGSLIEPMPVVGGSQSDDGETKENDSDAAVTTQSTELISEIEISDDVFETPDILTSKVNKDDVDIVRTMWATFRGISVVNADMFIHQLSLWDVIDGKSRDAINNIKYPNGRAVSKEVLARLINANANRDDLFKKLLSSIPGISSATAVELLAKKTLPELISSEPGVIAVIKVGKSQKNLGIKKAAAISKYFKFTLKDFDKKNAVPDAVAK